MLSAWAVMTPSVASAQGPEALVGRNTNGNASAHASGIWDPQKQKKLILVGVAELVQNAVTTPDVGRNRGAHEAISGNGPSPKIKTVPSGAL